MLLRIWSRGKLTSLNLRTVAIRYMEAVDKFEAEIAEKLKTGLIISNQSSYSVYTTEVKLKKTKVKREKHRCKTGTTPL